MLKRLFYVILLIVIFIRPVVAVYNQRHSFFTPGYSKRYEQLRKLYYSSQYVKKQNPSIIPDQTLEAFAGGIFLKGINPILIIHDQPPLGRYIIALSIKLFDNPSTIFIPLLGFSLLGIFLIGRLAIGSALLASIPVAIFANEPLFLGKISTGPLLESIQLPFIILALYFFTKAIYEKKYPHWFILTSVMLGFVISIRFFVLGAGLFLAMLFFFLLQKRIDRKIVSFLLFLPLSLMVLVLSYTKTLQSGYSIIQIFGIQKYILSYQQSKFILPFSFWDLLLFNKWHTWWGTNAISQDPQWIIFWPVALILTAVFLILVIIKRVVINDAEKIIFFWVGVVCIILSTGYTSTRYFLPLIPFLYILAVSFLTRFFKF